jgi:hypothetical protein
MELLFCHFEKVGRILKRPPILKLNAEWCIKLSYFGSLCCKTFQACLLQFATMSCHVRLLIYSLDTPMAVAVRVKLSTWA